MTHLLQRKNFALTVILLAVFSFSSIAQRARGNSGWKKYRHEIAFGYGVNNFMAGMGERTRLGFTYVAQRSTFNASYRYYLHNKVSLRASATHAYARKNDKTDNVSDRTNLRLDYLGSLSEFAIMGEYHLIDETGKGNRKSSRLSRGGISKGLDYGVSVFTGFAVNYMRPYAEYYGNLVELRPVNDSLGYAANNQSYKRLNFHIPLGINLRIILNQNWRVGAEFGYRFGFREYLNNVSGVYYHADSKAENSVFPDPSYTGGFVSYSRDSDKPIKEMAKEPGKRNYYFAMVTLAYRIKTK